MKMEAFDVFVRRQETGLPLITLTVSSQTTIAQLKKLFSEKCKYFLTFIIIIIYYT